MIDLIGGLVSLGDEIFSEGKEFRELNIGGGTIIMENIYSYGEQYYYGDQYYHGKQLNIIWLNASLIVIELRCYTPVIGKITVVILVRDRCPRGKGLLRTLLEQRIAAIMVAELEELEDEVESLHDDLTKLETSLKCCLGFCGAVTYVEQKEEMWLT
ncbi:hypothetical protein Tco_0301179 [Tanacetum coccineum]